MTSAIATQSMMLGDLFAKASALWPTSETWDTIFQSVESTGPWVGLVLIGLMVLHNVVPVPAEMIAICAGATCGLVWGVVVVWIGAMIGAVLAFWIAKLFGRSLLKRFGKTSFLERLDQMITKGNWHSLLLARLVPVVSFNLVNYGAGLLGVGWVTFLWTTAIGILPITILSVAAGAGLQVIGTGPAVILILAVTIALMLGHAFVKRRAAA